MTNNIDLAKISMSEESSKLIKITVSDDHLTQQFLQLFRDLIKQDECLAQNLKVSQNRKLKTIALKTKGKNLPQGFRNLKEIVEYLLTKHLGQEFSQSSDSQVNLQKTASGKNFRQSSEKPTPSADDEKLAADDELNMPSEFTGLEIDPLDIEPYDLQDDYTNLLGISGEDFDISASHITLENPIYEDEDEYGFAY